MNTTRGLRIFASVVFALGVANIALVLFGGAGILNLIAGLICIASSVSVLMTT